MKYGADGEEIKLELKDLSSLAEESDEDSDSEKEKEIESSSGESSTHRNLLKSTMSESNYADHVKETLQRREELLEFVAREIEKNLRQIELDDDQSAGNEPLRDIQSPQR